jgi:antitoxin HigA-1
VSQYRLAKAVDVPARRINEIVHGQRRITADTALRLSRYFGTSERFWLNLQARYDLEIEKDRLGAELDTIRPLSAASWCRFPGLLAVFIFGVLDGGGHSRTLRVGRHRKASADHGQAGLSSSGTDKL